MDIALDCGQNDRPLVGRVAALSSHAAANHLKALAGGRCRSHQLGQEQFLPLIGFANCVQRRNQHTVDDLVRRLLLQLPCHDVGHLRLQPTEHRLFQRHAVIRCPTLLFLPCPSKAANILLTAHILAGQYLIGRHCIHQLRHRGVDDRQLQTGSHSLREEHAGDLMAAGQAVGNIADAQHTAKPQFTPHQLYGLQRYRRLGLIHRGGHHKGINKHIVVWDAVCPRRLQNSSGNGQPPLRRGRNAVAVHRQTNDCRAVFFSDRQQLSQHLRPSVDRVENGLAVIVTQSRLSSSSVGGVDLQRQGTNRLYRTDHPAHGSRFIYSRQPHIEIQQIGPGIHLGNSLRRRVSDVALQQRPLQPFFPCGVQTLAQHLHAAQLHCLCGAADAAADGIRPLYRRFFR